MCELLEYGFFNSNKMIDTYYVGEMKKEGKVISYIIDFSDTLGRCAEAIRDKLTSIRTGWRKIILATFPVFASTP